MPGMYQSGGNPYGNKGATAPGTGITATSKPTTAPGLKPPMRGSRMSMAKKPFAGVRRGMMK